MKRFLPIIILFWLAEKKGNAQAPQFSQFYASPTYLNPAFAGETTQGRISSINRLQWPGITGAFQTYNLSYDHNVEKVGGGLGLILTHDKAGSGALRYTNISGIYSHRIPVNKFWTIKAGLQFGLTTRDINLNKLIFGSQLYNGGGTPTNVLLDYQKVSYPDFSTGVLAFSRKIWSGFSVHHLNQPNQSLISQETYVPMKFSLHGGYRYTISSGIFSQDLVFAFNYKAQAKFDQLDIGFYYDRLPMVFGLWYRGLPIKSYQLGYGNNDALVFLFGYTVKDIRIGYSYDQTISKLTGSTIGSHELTLTYELIDKRKKLSKRRKFVPCAKF